MQGWLDEAGIGTVGDLRALGSVEACRRVKFLMPGRATLNLLHALEAALRGCHWLALPPDVRATLRREGKAIEAALRQGRRRAAFGSETPLLPSHREGRALQSGARVL